MRGRPSLKQLDSLRKKVEAIDHTMLRLLTERFQLTNQIQQFKKAHSIRLLDQKREQALLAKYLLSPQIKKLPQALVKKIYMLIFSYSKKPGIIDRSFYSKAWNKKQSRKKQANR